MRRGVGEARRPATPDPDLLPIRVRRATAPDTDPVVAFTRTTWDGWDYLPDVLAVWLEARDGAVFAAEADPTNGRPIAVGRVAMLSATEAWMEGLRVDPALRGRGVATAFQIAELTWAQAQGAEIVRYATGETNEASLHLGAKHGFALGRRWRALRPFESTAIGSRRGAARGAVPRRTILARLAGAGLTADARPRNDQWERLAADPTFVAGERLYEWRAWAWQRLTPERLAVHGQRGELLAVQADDAWALGLLALERLPGETRIVLLAGDGDAANVLVDGVAKAAGRRPIVRLPDASPLLDELSPLLDGNGWRVGEHSLVLLSRALRDAADRPVTLPAEGLERVTFLEAPHPLSLVPDE